MAEFYVLLEHVKNLTECELYEDVKVICDLLVGIAESTSSLTSSIADGFVCEQKDKYMIYYLFGNAAFNLKEYKLAETLFNKALQINKSNLKPKTKAHTAVDCDTDINIKYNLHQCLLFEKKYQEAFSIVSKLNM